MLDGLFKENFWTSFQPHCFNASTPSQSCCPEICPPHSVFRGRGARVFPEAFFAIALANLLSPVVLLFLLGIAATLLRSDLKIPEAAYSFMTTYLLLALGMKGGVELSHISLKVIALPAIATLLLAVLTPFVAFFVCRNSRSMSVADSAALAAHYGSVSIVTFISSQSFLDARGVSHEGIMATLVVIMEMPAIVLALWLAQKFGKSEQKIGKVCHEILTGKSVLLMTGGLLVGLLSGSKGYAKVEPLFGSLFQGVVALFLLEMGMVASKRFKDFRKAGWFVVAFAVFIPLLNGALGSVLGTLAGLSVGGVTVLATMAASASYIAAPAAVRTALPEATPGIYLTAALAITFPFNLVFGIPIYFKMAEFLSGLLPHLSN
jgi:uncharacterized protein